MSRYGTIFGDNQRIGTTSLAHACGSQSLPPSTDFLLGKASVSPNQRACTPVGDPISTRANISDTPTCCCAGRAARAASCGRRRHVPRSWFGARADRSCARHGRSPLAHSPRSQLQGQSQRQSQRAPRHAAYTAVRPPLPLRQSRRRRSLRQRRRTPKLQRPSPKRRRRLPRAKRSRRVTAPSKSRRR